MEIVVSSASNLPNDVIEELQALTVKLKGAVVGKRIWEVVLSHHEQGQVELVEFLKYHPVDTYVRLRRVSKTRAVLDLAHRIDLLTDRQYEQLLARIGEVDRNSGDKPNWNPDRLELAVRGQVIRAIRSRNVAGNVVRVLDTFEELAWPDRIDDPLPGGADEERLRDTVKSLNKDLSGIRFRADGTGKGIIWDLT